MYDLGDVKLTFRKFYRINGGATQLKGVTPDIIIPDRLENAKLRERDNPDALAWDQIAKADYTTWNPGYSYSSAVASINQDVNNNIDFKEIQKQVNLLDKYRDEPTPLNINKYKQLQKNIEEAAKKLDEFSKSPVHLQTTTLPVDSLAVQGDTTKISRQEQFIKTISNDLYVDETVKALEKVIGEKQLAEAEKK
jgi:carboxyl-terminal processing protease